MQRIACVAILFTFLALFLGTACVLKNPFDLPPDLPPIPLPPPETSEECGFLVFSESRVEARVPVLNKIPYVQRLFANVSIGRDSQYIWDFGHSPFTPLIAHSASAISADGNRLLVGKNNGGAVSLFNLLDPADHQIELVPSRNDGRVRDYTVSQGGGYSFTTDFYKDIGSSVAWMQFTPDASAFLVYRIRRQNDLPDEETMELFDRGTGQLIRTFPIEPRFTAGAVSPDGRLLLAAGASSLEYWDLMTGQKVASAPLWGIGRLSDLRCTPDGRFVLLVPEEGDIRVYDFRSLSEVARIPVANAGYSNVLNKIDISPDGRVLVVVSDDQYSYWFSATTPHPRYLVSGNVISIPSRIGRYEIGTWNLLSEHQKSSADTRKYRFYRIRFSQDGNRLIAIGETKEANKGGELGIRRDIFEFDFRNPDEGWKRVEFTALPLHPDAKFLLDGRSGTSPSFSRFHERVAATPRVRIW